MKYKIKQFMKADISKFYILGVGIICLLLVGGFFSYAMFTVSKEKSNAIRIVTGNLTYKLEVDGSAGNTLTVGAGETKEFTVTLSNPNNRIARFNFYYVGTLDSDVEAGYVSGSGINIPPESKGINLEKSGASGSSNTYKIRVKNSSTSSKTITLGVSVGLDYNDLTLPSNGHLFEKLSIVAVQFVKSKANSESLDYNTASTEQQKEMWTFSHPATEQTAALTDYRYIGANPNNYVTFNDELWRIIGVFTTDDGTGKKEERLKLIRNESIGNYSWDNKDTSTGAGYRYGKNNWPDARLNYLLNPGHEDESIGGSLYWNSGSGTCYSGQNNATTSCNFTTTGLKDKAKNMIGDTLWYLGGAPTNYTSASNGLTSHFYSYERGTTVYSGRDTSWIGKVGLMYTSDYGYATSGGTTTNRNACLNKELFGWDSSSYSDCKNNDWLYNSRIYQWTIMSCASNSFSVFGVNTYGYLSIYSARNSRGVRPVVHLKSNIKITEGNGSKETPYVLAG